MVRQALLLACLLSACSLGDAPGNRSTAGEDPASESVAGDADGESQAGPGDGAVPEASPTDAAPTDPAPPETAAPAGTPSEAPPTGDTPPAGTPSEAPPTGDAPPAATPTDAGQAPTSTPATTIPAAGALRVEADGSGHFTTITEALAGLAPGREVRVGPGVYREAIRFEQRAVLSANGGPVVVDGGRRPGLAVDATAQVVISGIEFTSDVAAVSLVRGQLVLNGCRMTARPEGVALRTMTDAAQLRLNGSWIDAAAGTALQLHPKTKGGGADNIFTWEPRQTPPVLDAGPSAPIFVQRTTLGWLRQGAAAKLTDILAKPLPMDGRVPLLVQPERSNWPLWAVGGVTHFETIASALAAASSGVRVDIVSGVYDESVGLRQPVHVRALGPIGSVVIRRMGSVCLWSNAAAGVARSTVTGLRFVTVAPDPASDDVAESGEPAAPAKVVPTVQVNGGEVELVDCEVSNPTSHGIVVTSSVSPSAVSLVRCEIDTEGRALFVSGESAAVDTLNCTVTSSSVGVFARDGGQISMVGGRLQGATAGLDLWGELARVNLRHVTVSSSMKLVRLGKGAARSQVTTTNLVIETEPGG